MTVEGEATFTAENESKKALHDVLTALKGRSSFKLEAGAGAGKTTSLINALQHILADKATYLPRTGQRVACITYTNVARNEIIRRTDASPHVFAETIHGFLWEVISPFRKALLEEIISLPRWESLLEGRTSLQDFTVSYDLGFRGLENGNATLHHDDVPALAVRLLGNRKFRSLVADKFPIIFVDEYQDTPAGLAEAMLGNAGSHLEESTYGFFGDHWQQIYDKTCGSIDHLPVVAIQKKANWRSSSAVVHLLNGMRPELPQAPVAGAAKGSVVIYHTNSWAGPRGTRSKKGQIPDDVLKETLRWVASETRKRLHYEELKILMLTHSSIASELDFGNIDKVFKYNEDYIRKRDEVVAFLLDVIEPCSEHFRSRQYGPMLDTLKRSRPRMQKRSDKNGWSELFARIDEARAAGTVGDLVDIVLRQRFFSPPQALIDRQRKWEQAIQEREAGCEVSLSRRVEEFGKLRAVSYREVLALRRYVEEQTPFSTQHGVKGAEYPGVLAVFGGGWTRYNFPAMLTNFAERESLGDEESVRFERSRNLFYVACSRAKVDLTLLFTTELSGRALETLEEWVGSSNVVGIRYTSEGVPANP
ncbi:UvrD-helicase domain-containing protein [Streptomyces sp. NPDC057336]|uniref:UvrD-helicase domain-containing protein n=1 Tax=Streptomyces sp. NPDC057336 TaxID=3346102 RepID=UPI00363880E3